MTMLKNLKEKYPTLTLEQLPKNLQIAIDVYSECWHELPFDMHPPTRSKIEYFLKYKYRLYSEDNIERIITISTPENAPREYTPNREFLNFSRIEILKQINDHQEIYKSDKIAFLLSVIDGENFQAVVGIIDDLVGILKKEEIENDN